MKKYQLLAYEIETDTGDIKFISKMTTITKEELESIINTFSKKYERPVLKPFQKILGRISDDDKWEPAIYKGPSGNERCPFGAIGGMVFKQIIPYEGNEHLLGTTNED